MRCGGGDGKWTRAVPVAAVISRAISRGQVVAGAAHSGRTQVGRAARWSEVAGGRMAPRALERSLCLSVESSRRATRMRPRAPSRVHSLALRCPALPCAALPLVPCPPPALQRQRP